MMWISTPASTNPNVTANNVVSVLCPAMGATIAKTLTNLSLPLTASMPQMTQGTCSAVTAIQSGGLTRVAYKYYFAVTAAQWANIVRALYSQDTIRTGHVLCGSTVSFQSISPVKDTVPQLTETSKPAWLAASQAAATTCYTDVYSAAHP